jgi:predicted SprT family Zn-dependent metalloprotease
MVKGANKRPTEATYEAFQTAFDHFNRALFDGKLPPCLITLQRRDKRTMGYLWADRFGAIGGSEKTAELAMNPHHFHARDLRDTLSTLAHEMVHLRQLVAGKPSRTGYHNKEWAGMMKEVGLYPSSTGQPGGKEVGQKMTHYIVEGGPFTAAFDSLAADGFSIPWGELVPGAGEDGEGEEGEGDENKSNRVKYMCGGCEAKVWGKPDLEIFCGACQVPFECEAKPA